MAFFGSLDAAFFQTYSFSQFFTGQIGDIYNKRIVLAISLSIQAVIFGCIGLLGESFVDL